MSELKDLIVKGESKTLEFKETLPSSEKIAKTIIAFSNSAGGRIILGVNDKREIPGIQNIDIFDWQDRISSIIHDSCYPNIIPEFYTTSIDEKLIFIVEVSKGNLLPYYLKSKGKQNGTYIRIGSSNRLASPENIKELERQSRYISFDTEAFSEKSFREYNYDFLKEQFQAKGKDLNIEKLENLRIVKKEVNSLYPTNGFLILSGLMENCSIKCSRFKGKTVEVFIDRKEFTGDIFSILSATEKFILNHINLRGEVLGLQRTDTYEIPVPAIREVIINALVHRDYSNLGRDIKVSVFDDRISVVSPGCLPNTITVEQIMQGRSEIRNRVIALVFKELALIEQWGSGVLRVISLCEKAGLRTPELKETGDSVEFIIHRAGNSAGKPTDNRWKTDGKATEKRRETAEKNTETAASLTKQEKIIFEYLSKEPSITSNEVQSLLSVKETRSREILRKMTQKGYLHKYEEGKNTFYTLVKQTIFE